MTPFLVNPKPLRKKKNPSHLMIVNKRKERSMEAKKRKRPKGGWNFEKAKRAVRPARRRAKSRARAYRPRANPRRRVRRRKNPLFRGRSLEQMLLVGGGFLLAPMASGLIPFEPTTALGGYIKKAAAVTIGGTIATQVLGKRYGNALLLGGMISVGVDILRDFVPAFGGGVGAYFPPNAEIEAMSAGNGMAATNLLPDDSSLPGRWSSRYGVDAGMGMC